MRHVRPIAVVVRPDIVWHQSGTDVVLGKIGGLVSALSEWAGGTGARFRRKCGRSWPRPRLVSPRSVGVDPAQDGPDTRQLALVPRGNLR